jgi:hypothetical protein
VFENSSSTLQTLVIPSFTTANLGTTFLNTLTNLIYLDIDMKNLTNESDVNIQCPKLQSLSIRANSSIIFKVLGVHRKDLRSLNISVRDPRAPTPMKTRLVVETVKDLKFSG